MAVDVRSRYFAEPEEFFMPDNGAMSPSFSVLPQYELPNNNFMVMPPAAAPYAEPYQYTPAVQPMTQEAVAPYVEPYQYTPAAQPMTQEAAPAEAMAPYDLSSLAGLDLSGLAGLDLSGLNLIGGGGYPVDPNVQYIGAPLSNKGNPTSQTGGNTFAVGIDQPVRLVDHRTNQVVFEGTGFDAARKATELGQGLTDQFGRKANYSIQTADPTGAYNTVAYEKKNKSTLGTIGNVVGTALPIAVGFIPGLQGVGAVLAAAGAGGAGAALRGDNILKGIAMGGLSAAGGQYLGSALKNAGVGLSTNAARAIGTGVGSTAGGLATGQNLQNSLLGGVASGGLSYLGGEIMKPGAPKTTGVGADANVNAVNAPVDPSALTVTGTRIANLTSPSVNISSTNKAPVAKDPEVLDPNRIVVTGTRTPNLTSPSVNFSSTNNAPVANDVDALDPNRIVVTGTRTPDLTSPSVDISSINNPPAASDTGALDPNRIVVTGTRTPDLTSSTLAVPGFTLSDDTLADIEKKAAEEQAKEDEERKKLGVADYLRLAGLAAGLIGGGGGGGGGGGAGGSQAINPIFSAKLPTPGAGGAFKVGGLDYTTPPARSAADMYRYAMGPAMDIPAGMDLRGATSPYAGYGPGTLGEETFKRVTGMAHGGAMGYARGSSRDSFAVDGPGTGRSDDIPAVLSDGEYVIDAETVALLGDGSSKAGAKKLDEMRVKVRKHKGRNLAKGKFSVNAKRPEKYLSGGRT